MQKQLRRTRYERGVPRPGILPKLRAEFRQAARHAREGARSAEADR